MKIAFVTGWGVVPQNGGQGTFCACLVRQLARRGHTVSVLSRNLESWNQWAADVRLDGDVKFQRPNRAALLACDVVHLNGPGVRQLALTAWLKRPTVVTHQGYHLCCPEGTAWHPTGCDVSLGRLGPCEGCRWRTPLAHMHLQVQSRLVRFARNVAVSDCVRTRLDLDQTVLNPYDVGVVPDLSSAAVERKLAFIGRLVPEKGPQIAIEALSHLSDVTLDIYGQGVMEPELRRLAEHLGLTDRVRFRGMVPSPVVDAASAAAIAVPGLWDEPLGYVTIEAMAAGKAVIATAIGGSLELVTEDRGWLVRPGDPADLARALDQVLRRPAERIARGSRAREFIRATLDPVHTAEQYEDIYRRQVQRFEAAGG